MPCGHYDRVMFCVLVACLLTSDLQHVLLCVCTHSPHRCVGHVTCVRVASVCVRVCVHACSCAWCLQVHAGYFEFKHACVCTTFGQDGVGPGGRVHSWTVCAKTAWMLLWRHLTFCDLWTAVHVFSFVAPASWSVGVDRPELICIGRFWVGICIHLFLVACTFL